MMKTILLSLLILPILGFCQETKQKDYESGKIELGVRSTISAFGNHGFVSTGVGGQFRIRFGSRLNTEWFADYITANLGGLGRRTDAHIGWSVMAYPFKAEIKKNALLPYILGGHCFDYTRIERATTASTLVFSKPAERWSSAIHLGMGTHYYLTHNFNISLAAQYMIHLGNDVEAQLVDDPTNPGTDYLYIQEGELGLEGHLFFTLSANIYLGDLWSKKPKS